MLGLKLPRGVALVLRDDQTGRVLRVDPAEFPRGRHEVRAILDRGRPIGAMARTNADGGGKVRLRLNVPGWRIGTERRPPPERPRPEGDDRP